MRFRSRRHRRSSDSSAVVVKASSAYNHHAVRSSRTRSSSFKKQVSGTLLSDSFFWEGFDGTIRIPDEDYVFATRETSKCHQAKKATERRSSQKLSRHLSSKSTMDCRDDEKMEKNGDDSDRENPSTTTAFNYAVTDSKISCDKGKNRKGFVRALRLVFQKR